MRIARFLALALLLTSCTTTIGDLDSFETFEDACDPRGTPFEGQDFELRFINTNAHINNEMFGAVQVGPDREVEAVVVLSGFDDPNLRLTIPELLPGQPSTFAFWMDTNSDGVFTQIGDDGTDHQWLRPICPDGSMTFTHTTPFQDVRGARSVGLIFRFLIPDDLQRNADLFNTFRMTARATRIEGARRQTRAYYRWAPYVGPTPSSPRPLRVVDALPTPRTCTSSPECADFSTSGGNCVIPSGQTMGNCVSNLLAQQVTEVTVFQMGGNALGEARGPIDTGSEYEIEFIIDVDCPVTDTTCVPGDPRYELGSFGDAICVYRSVAPTMGAAWEFRPDVSIAACDFPAGFNPSTFSN